jgi:hypothetical protein
MIQPETCILVQPRLFAAMLGLCRAYAATLHGWKAETAEASALGIIAEAEALLGDEVSFPLPRSQK